MRKLAVCLWLSSAIAMPAGCSDEDEPASKPPETARAAPRRVPQVQPPIDVKAPPSDAAKTASGLPYKRLVARSNGAQASASSRVLIRYTGWRQRTGETFFTTGRDGQTIAIDVAHAAPGFRELLPLLHKGEKAILWLPPGGGMPEPVAYEVELVDVLAGAPPSGQAAPAIHAAQLSPLPPGR